MTPPARRRLGGLTLVLAAALLAGAARAEEVHKHYTGKVSVVAVSPGPVQDALAAHGVVQGASASVDFTFESTTPVYFSADTTSVYLDAVVNVTISIGTYVAQSDPPLAAVINSVSVDDKPQDGSGVDSYSVTTSGTDTDNIMGVTENSVSLSVVLNDTDASAFDSQDLVQDLGGMKAGLASFGSGQGMVFIMLEVGSGGGGGGTSGSALARKGQMVAGSHFGRDVLKAQAKFAAAPPEKDPLGAKEAALIDKAHDAFLVQFVKAVSKALKKGGTAPLGVDQKDAAAASVQDACEALTESLLTGADPQAKDDRALRGKLIRAASAQIAADFAAQAKDVLKPNPDKLADKLAKSRAKLQAAFGKALDKAGKQGVAYAGPGADEVSDAVTTLVDAYVQLTADGL